MRLSSQNTSISGDAHFRGSNFNFDIGSMTTVTDSNVLWSSSSGTSYITFTTNEKSLNLMAILFHQGQNNSSTSLSCTGANLTVLRSAKLAFYDTDTGGDYIAYCRLNDITGTVSLRFTTGYSAIRNIGYCIVA